MKKLLTISLCVALLLCGCGIQAEEAPAPGASGEPTEVITAQDSLSTLRDSLVPPVMAVAYLGYFDMEPEGGVMTFLREEFPAWLAQMDFVEQIPEERIFGSYGSLWLVVPRDGNANVAVNRVSLTGDSHFPVEEVLYSRNAGEPVLILADYNDNSTLSVVVTDSTGAGVIWYPTLGQTEALPEGGPTGYQVADFTPMSEKSEYELYQRNGWHSPAADELMDSFWLSDYGWGLELLSDSEESALLYCVDAEGAYTITHVGSWTMEDDQLLLELSPMQPDGAPVSGAFPVLLDPWGDGWLWFGRSEDGSALPGFPKDLPFDELIRPDG
jgi:hypothetical protein